MLVILAALMPFSLGCLIGEDFIDRTFHPGDWEEQILWGSDAQTDGDSTWGAPTPSPPAGQPTPLGGFMPPAQPALPKSHAPVITSIDFPAAIPADGKTYYGWVSFTDAHADANRLSLHVLHSTTPMSDWEGEPQTLEGTTAAGKYRIGFYCTIPSLHTMQITLADGAGNNSTSMDFSWECK